MAKKTTSKPKENAVRQGNKPSYGKPPVEHQFKPGQSGNPKGPPKHRTNLWVWYCKYMNMTQAQLDKLDRTKLTAAQRTALTLVENAVSGEGSGAERMARYVVDREEGKAVEHLIIGDDNNLTDAECEELRNLIRGNHGRNTDQ